MEQSDNIERVKAEMLSGVKALLGDALDSLILYGSYARGDYDGESDMDFLVLTNLNRQRAEAYRKPLYALANTVGLEHDIVVSVGICDLETFTRYYDLIPFYQNVNREGVKIA